jgi:hypothetical protein
MRRVEIISIWRDANDDDPPDTVLKIGNWRFRTLWSVFAPDSLNTRLLQLWSRLPKGGQARCHVPPYALRFHDDKEVPVLVASLCWACNNIQIESKGIFETYEFDGKSAVSQEIFNLCVNIEDSSHPV